MGLGDYLFWLILLGCSLRFQVLRSQNHTCNWSDQMALEGFMKGLESSTSGWVFSSNGSDCCGWAGVSCKGSRVVGLEFVNMKLRGTISESLSDLDQLRTLNLSRNSLEGRVPLELFHLHKLEVLDLSYNSFYEYIPAETNLPSLRTLDVSKNYFSGPISAGICLNSTQLRVLNFSFNNFYGEFAAGFGSCTFLERLAVNSNHLVGSLPRDLFSLKNLSFLYLQDNELSGPLSYEINNLSSLIQLGLSINRFSGFLPDAFGSLKKLKQLTAHTNNFTGIIPSSLSNSPSIQVLSLRNNSLYGSININRNNLNSQIPESFKDMQSLSYLSLTRTGLRNISAALSILQHCRNLSTIVLAENFPDEVMPAELDVEFENLTALMIANCNLTGSMPQWLHKSVKLLLLDRSSNRFSGSIPDWFGSMKFLFYFDLSNNALSGKIPSNLTRLESLIDRNITFQESPLDFPFFKRRLTSTGLQYNKMGSFPPSLDLSFNTLSGHIPPGFGNLKQLVVLKLNSNALSGPIPSELSNMRRLETLDLSSNTLSGIFPPSLSNLNFLSTFSVAYNQLEGMIPSGGQFLTFPKSSFEGNVDLCGEQLKPCDEHTAYHDFSDSDIHIPSNMPIDNKAIIIGMAVGIVLGTIYGGIFSATKLVGIICVNN